MFVLCAFLAGCAVVSAGCAAARPTHTQIITPADAKVAAVRRQFDSAVPAVLQLLSESDIRLAARMGHGTGGDPFLTTEREQFLEESVDQLSRIEISVSDPLAGDARMAAMMQEQRILDQLVVSERLRLERERDFAASSIDLVSAMTGYVDEGQAQDPDTLVAWRVQMVRDALKPNTISGFQREELRAVLAAIGRRGPKTQTEVTATFKRLETLPVAPYPLLYEGALDKELAAFVGLPASLDAVEPFLEKAGQAIRFQIDVAFGVLTPAASEDVRRRAMAILAKPPPCLPAAHVTTAREMGPPDERTRACGLVRALSIAQGDIDELAALLALHEAIVTAGRSASMHARVRDAQVAARRWPRLLVLAPDAEQRELLLAANHPTKAIAGGAAAGVLTMGGGAKVRERAREWMRFGDATFDVIDEHLAVQPHTSSAPASGSPKPPPR